MSCLGATVYLPGSKTHYFDFLSYNLSHDGLFTRHCLDLLIPKVQELSNVPVKL